MTLLWNDVFYNIAFTDDEKKSIPLTFVDNSAESTLNETNDNACADTEDKIYLLSRKETYCSPFSSDLTTMDEKKIAVATDYARAMGVELWRDPSSDKYGNTNWWTRSAMPGSDRTDLCYYINEDGIRSALSVTEHVFGVRPALHINK